MKRTLSLRTETLADLTPQDLVTVAGGNNYTNDQVTCPVLRCPFEYTHPPRCASGLGCTTG